MLGQREALPSNLYRKYKFVEEEGGDLLNLNLTLKVKKKEKKKKKVKSHRNPMVIPRE